MDFRQTQIGLLLEQIKKAVLAHTPIIYIPTNQMEVIDEMLFHEKSIDSLIPRVYYNPKEQTVTKLEYFDKGEEKGSTCNILDNYIIGTIDADTIRVPSILVSYTSDWQKVVGGVKNFIASYLGVKHSKQYESPSHTDSVRKSICIVVTPQEQTIPVEIAPYVKTIHVPVLSDDEILDAINTELNKNAIDCSLFGHDLMNQMKVCLRGFSKRNITDVIHQLIMTQDIDYDVVRADKVLDVIRSQKRQMLENSNGLKWETVKITNAAGLEGITSWLDERLDIFKDPENAQRKHIDIPNGLLVSGIPGSGKSLMAKTAAYKLGLPLISLDMGALLGGIMGESEHNMINALAMAEKMAPCVLWIDEIEKAFSGSSQNSSSSDGGVGRRMFGKFLTWMQEKSSACFVFATSNDITCLPPELFRSERFDRKFFTFMPMAEDCAKIFAANIGAQNEKYQRELDKMSNEEKKTLPGSLFPDELQQIDTWLPILNSCCTIDFDACSLVKDDNEIYQWKSKKRPVNKLFTGADISAIIKEAKFKVATEHHSSYGDCVYNGKTMLQKVRESIAEFQPYGETNLYDIVKCFRSLYENRFKSAAINCIVDFSHYDDDRKVYEVSNEEQSRFKHTYDKVLFATIVGAINYYSKEKRNKS